MISMQKSITTAVVSEPYVYGLSRSGVLMTFTLSPAESKQAVDRLRYSFANAGDGNDIELIDGHLVLSDYGGIAVYSLTDPKLPRPVGRFRPPHSAISYTLTRDHDRLYVIGRGHVACFDVANVARPRLIFESTSGHHWWTGCVIGGRLLLGECAPNNPNLALPNATPRDGVAVMEIEPEGLKEIGFISIKGAFQLFATDAKHALACLDPESLTHLGQTRPYGRAVLIDVTNPAAPAVGPVQANASERSAILVNRLDGKVLVCPGYVFPLEKGFVRKRVEFPISPECTIRDGSPYHPKASGDWVALPCDRVLVVIRLAEGDQAGDPVKQVKDGE